MAEHEQETNLLAFFHRLEQAEQALKQLEQKNVIDSSIGNIDGYPGVGNDKTSNPLTGNFPGLGYLTLGGDFEHDAGVLVAANVSASGMSAGHDNQVTGRNIVLTVIVKDEYAEEAARILEDAGAMI